LEAGKRGTSFQRPRGEAPKSIMPSNCTEGKDLIPEFNFYQSSVGCSHDSRRDAGATGYSYSRTAAETGQLHNDCGLKAEC
jgi:hypothetical protein